MSRNDGSSAKRESVLHGLGISPGVAIGPAFAADPVFPPGVRVGMVPLVGLVRAKTFIDHGWALDRAIAERAEALARGERMSSP